MNLCRGELHLRIRREDSIHNREFRKLLLTGILPLILIGTFFPPTAICQGLYGTDTPPELAAVFHGPDSLRAYICAGGKFTGKKNAYGQTAAMLAAASSAEVIQLFVSAGGKFTDDRDANGRTAAMYAVRDEYPGSQNDRERPAAIAAFAKAGGKFTDDQDAVGLTAAIEVAGHPNEVAAFVSAGEYFGYQQTKTGYTAGMYAISGGVPAIRAFSAAGGKFTSQQQVSQKSAKDIAAEKGPEVFAAYEEAVKMQGGLVYLSNDTEFTAFRNALALESYVKAGGHFDLRQDEIGQTAAMIAVTRGPAMFRMFADYGGKFTTQQDKQRSSIETLVPKGESELRSIYTEAVKRQGGLITVTPVDEYEAARIGAAGIKAFTKAGGKFTDKPNQDDLTSAMIAAASGPEAVEAFHKVVDHWSNWQNSKGFTVAMVIVIAGADTIRAFGRTGGKFTAQRDEHGMTAALWSATARDNGWPSARMALKFPAYFDYRPMGGGDRIQAFFESGGRFTEEQNNNGETAAMLVIDNGPDATKAYAKAGGQFTEQETKSGLTAEIYAVFRCADEVRAFAEAGGHFTDHVTSSGDSSEKTAALGEPDIITAYSEAGGIFTDRDFGNGWTSEKLASDKSEWMAESMAKHLKRPVDQGLRDQWKKRFAERDVAAAKAYREAIARHGGMRHVH